MSGWIAIEKRRIDKIASRPEADAQDFCCRFPPEVTKTFLKMSSKFFFFVFTSLKKIEKA
jgi:hypothetical protein